MTISSSLNARKVKIREIENFGFKLRTENESDAGKHIRVENWVFFACVVFARATLFAGTVNCPALPDRMRSENIRQSTKRQIAQLQF